MRTMIYKIFTGCYIVAALVLVAACNDGLDIQTKYPFTVETMPVPKELKVNETAEIRCELKREGRWEDTRYTIRWFLFDGEGTLKLEDGTVLFRDVNFNVEKGDKIVFLFHFFLKTKFKEIILNFVTNLSK